MGLGYGGGEEHWAGVEGWGVELGVGDGRGEDGDAGLDREGEGRAADFGYGRLGGGRGVGSFGGLGLFLGLVDRDETFGDAEDVVGDLGLGGGVSCFGWEVLDQADEFGPFQGWRAGFVWPKGDGDGVYPETE